MTKSYNVKEKQREFLWGSHWWVIEGEAGNGIRKGPNIETFKKKKTTKEQID
jgi:hypothetical protein